MEEARGGLGKLVRTVLSFNKNESLWMQDEHGNWRFKVITCMTDASLLDTLAQTKFRNMFPRKVT